MSIFLEWGQASLNKFGEELCGDKVERVLGEDSITLVLSDGLGSGVKANILSTLTSKILSTLFAGGIATIDAVETVLESLPVCKVRNVAYATFSVLHLDKEGRGYLIEFDTPIAVIVRNGKELPFEREEILIQGRKVYKTDLDLVEGDMVITMSDGVIHAGIGMLLNFGWQREELVKFIEDNFDKKMSARALTALIAGACKDLYLDKPGDDTTIACLKVRKDEIVNIMVGPPLHKEDDQTVVKQFLSGEGKHIVCGGTSSQIVARYLGKEVETTFDYLDKDVPPMGYIEGIDLTTEGVVTLRKLLELSENYIDIHNVSSKVFKKQDGASRLADLIFEDATKVVFHVGRSVNSAHSGEIDLTMKMKIIEKLGDVLKGLDKEVEINYH